MQTKKESRKGSEGKDMKQIKISLPKEKRKCTMCPKTIHVNTTSRRKTCSPKCRIDHNIQYNIEYRQRPEVKEMQRQYNKKYLQQPGILEKRRKYERRCFKNPEIQNRRRQQQREYCSRPEVIQRRTKYHHQWYQRTKLKEASK